MFHQQMYSSHPITSGGINDKKHLGGRYFILDLRHPDTTLAQAAAAALREVFTAQEVSRLAGDIGRVVLLPDSPDPEEAGKHRIIMGAYAEALAKHRKHPLCVNLSVILRAWIRSYERAAAAAAALAASKAEAEAAASVEGVEAAELGGEPAGVDACTPAPTASVTLPAAAPVNVTPETPGPEEQDEDVPLARIEDLDSGASATKRAIRVRKKG